MTAFLSACVDARDHAAATPARTYFFLTGETGPGLLPRVLAAFDKLSLVPYRVHASTEHGTGEEMSLELRFTGLTREAGEQLAGKLRAIVGMRSVMTVVENG